MGEGASIEVLALPVVTLAAMLGLWWVRGRDPDPRPVDVRYEPPEGLGPAECGVLLDARVRLRHVTAALLDLAARDHLAIEEVEPRPEDDLERDFRLRALTAQPEWAALPRHERILLHLLFSPADAWPDDLGPAERFLRSRVAAPDGRDTVRMSDLGQPLRAVQGMKGFFHPLVEAGYFPRRPGWTRLRFLGLGALVLLAGFGAASAPAAYAAVLLSAAIVAGVGWHMPARTPEGRRAAEHVAGYREYLDRTASDRFERIHTEAEDLDRPLAYAAALGVESAWTEALDDLYGDRIETMEEGEEEAYRRLAAAGIRRLLSSGGPGEREA